MAESNAFTQCRDLALPLPPSSVALQNGAAMSSVMRAMGVQTCRTTDVASGILPYITTFSAHLSVGCEQVAVLASAIDQTQRAIQCTVSKVSQSSSQSVIATNNIEISLEGNAVITCIQVNQDINLKIGSVVDFGSAVTTSMASDLSATMKNFANVVQNAEKDALSTPAANRAATLFSTFLQQTAFQGSFETIIQESIATFQSGNSFTLHLTDYSMIGLLNPPPNLLNNGCLVINQQIVMQVMAQTIMDNILTHVFDNELASDWSNEWLLDQQSKSNAAEAVTLGNFIAGILGILILLAVVGLVLFMLLKGGGNNVLMGGGGGGGGSSSSPPGQRGVTIAGVLIALGILVFIIGIIIVAAGWSSWGGIICIVVGLIVAALAGFLLWRAKKLQAENSVLSTKKIQANVLAAKK